MEELYNAINSIEDENIKNALAILANELTKVKTIPPVAEDLTQLAYAVNKITGAL